MNTISIEEMRTRITEFNEASDFYRWKLVFDPRSFTKHTIIATAFDARHGMISLADACRLMIGVSSWYFATFEMNPIDAIIMDVPCESYLAIRCNLL